MEDKRLIELGINRFAEEYHINFTKTALVKKIKKMLCTLLYSSVKPSYLFILFFCLLRSGITNN